MPRTSNAAIEPEAPADDVGVATLHSIDPTLVDVAPEFNPRTTMDDDLLRELTQSVRSVGVLQPITLVRAEAERYRLVVGHRRLQAARNAKLAVVPALVYDSIDDGSRLQFAIIENLQREEMNPVDEAVAYQRAITEGALTQKQLASIIGKSPSHISDRLRLLKLPEQCRTHIATGALPITAAKPLGLIARSKAKHADEIADACANLVVHGAADLADLLDEPHLLLLDLASPDTDVDMEHPIPFLYRVQAYNYRPVPLAGHVDAEAFERAQTRAAALGNTRFTADAEDVDAARAYGCLLEFESGLHTHRFITDASFLLDRINLGLDTAEREQAERAKDAEASDPARSSRGTTDPKATRGASTAPVIDVAATNRAEREQSERARIAAIHANRELGVRLAKQIGAYPLDRRVAELLSRMVLSQNRELAARGIVYTHEEHHELTTKRQKNGKPRTTFTITDPHTANERALDWVLRPRSADEILGRLLQLLIAGTFADDRAVAKSNRTHWYAPAATSTEPIIARLARKVLPEHFHAAADRLLPKTPKKAPKATPAVAKAKQAANAD